MRIPASMTTEIAPAPEQLRERRARSLTLVQSGDGALVTELVEGESHWTLEPGTRLVFGRDPGDSGAPLDDSRTSRQHAEVRFARGKDAFVVRDLGSKNGSFVDGEKIDAEVVLSPGTVIRIGESLLVYSDITVPDGLAVPAPKAGVSPARALAEAGADLAAPTDLPILIVGPTGVGKELMSHRVHSGSSRKGKLVAVNCSTFSRDLVGSELFGHTAGAFSGAKSARSGLFASADGGTLFLDEIAELPLEQQPALLRALQEGMVRPVGSDREVAVNVRVVAATHQPLESLVERGSFREDLYARLAGFLLDLPALTERREEILSLFHLFLGDTDRPLSTEAAEALLVYAWPQNIRELKHAAERTKLFAKNLDQIGLSALPPNLKQRGWAPAPKASTRMSEPAADAEEPSKEALEAMLHEHGGNVAQVARATGRHRQQVYRWLKKYALDADAYRPEDS